jgi:hypothetical protein
MAPSSYNPMDGLHRSGGPGTMISAPTNGARETARAPNDFAPESRKRKLDEVGGHQQDDRVRLRLQFNHEGSSISPTSYRTYSDFPRSSYPPQMPAPATARHPNRSGLLAEGGSSTVVKTVVRAPTSEQTGDHTAISSVDCVGRKSWAVHGHPSIRRRQTSMRCGVNWSRTTGQLKFPPPSLVRVDW